MYLMQAVQKNLCCYWLFHRFYYFPKMHLRFLYFLGEKSSLILIIDYIVMILEHNESLGILIFVKSCIMAFFCEKDPKSDEGF